VLYPLSYGRVRRAKRLVYCDFPAGSFGVVRNRHARCEGRGRVPRSAVVNESYQTVFSLRVARVRHRSVMMRDDWPDVERSGDDSERSASAWKVGALSPSYRGRTDPSCDRR
jgi:hypothetical protein